MTTDGSRARSSGVFASLAIAFGSLVSTPAGAQLRSSASDPVAPRQAPPRDPYVFVFDGKLGVEPSVRTLDSLGRLIFRYEDVLPFGNKPEIGFGDKALGVLGRSLKLLFIDEPIAELTTVTVHELGGHGARGRELGLRPSFLFNAPGIYQLLFASRADEAAGGYTRYLTEGTVEDTKEVVSVLGGLEANYVHAWWINARIVHQRGRVHHGDLLTYMMSKLPYAGSFLSSSLERGGTRTSNDVMSYVTGLQEVSNGWRAEDRRRIARRLSAGYVWNLVDPTLFYAFYGVVVSSIYRGERMSRMPLPTIGRWQVFPSPRFGLTPFGAEQGIDVFLSPREGGPLLDVHARVGTSGITNEGYWGAGARLLGAELFSRHVPLGVELDVWRQPEILVEERALFDRPNRMGVNAGVFADVRLLGGRHRDDPRLGMSAKLAAKTAGYVPGQPVAGGAHGYVGLSLAW